jgi:hypothetical protein
MGLLDLPLEIIDVIIDLSLPLGIESFVLTCKALHGRAKKQIQRHNALSRRWKCADNYSTLEAGDTFGLLYAIALNPLVAHYIEVLDLWDRRWTESLTHSSQIWRDGCDYRKDPEAIDKVLQIIAKSAFYHSSILEEDQTWADALTPIEEQRDTWQAVVVLLGLLPNLRVLRLSPRWEEISNDYLLGGEGYPNSFTEILSSANQDHGLDKPLGKLEVLLPSMDGGYEQKMALQGVQPFMTLNSLHEMYLVSAVAVDDHYSGIPFEWKFPALSSALTRLELASSCIDADGLSNLIAHTPRLTIFKYSHETKYHGCEHDWNPGTFIEALARHCGNTLLEVAITIDELFGDIVNGASSFLALPNIRKLEVDILVFCGPPIESGQRQGQNAKVPEGERAWTKDDIPCIGSMVPEGIRDVHINTGYPVTDATALLSLLKNLETQRAERLHALETVIIRQYGGNSAQEMVDWAGATLEPFDLDVQEMRLRSMMPEWKRKFHDRVTSLAHGFR